METTNVDFAIRYAQKGWRVFPVKPGAKLPLINEWQIQATTDEKTIHGWWDTWPTANIGIATGKASGFFVLDIDGPEGQSWVERMIEQKGNLPNTPIQNTGGGGRHFLFTYPTGRDVHNSAKKIANGVDVRGEGGFIVAPPSLHESGRRYKWDDNHLPSQTVVADAPEWLLALIELAAKRNEAQAAAEPVNGKAVVQGGRNQHLTGLAGAMRRKGMDYDAILAALSVENATKCVPPLDHKEVETIAKSVSRYEPTDAPVLSDRDRATAEWNFAKAVYLVTDHIKEFMWLPSSKFSNPRLAKFWQDLLDGTDPVMAATNSGILADLEALSVDPFYIDGYAKAIDSFGYFDQVNKYSSLLKKAAEARDAASVDKVVTEIARSVQPTTGSRVADIADVFTQVEAQIAARVANPTDVWGIPYSPYHIKDYTWPTLSKFTGGKHKGELTLIPGEPGVGKSWWTMQDALFTAISGTPVFIWSGEMRREQVLRRMLAILGVNGRNMKTGNMTQEDYIALADAKALILNSPLYISDQPGLALHDLKALLYRQKAENGIEQFVIDYAYLVNAPGKDEIEKTANVSRETKVICQELDLAGHLIASVNKTGMDTNGQSGGNKSDLRGSGQQIHDADNILKITKFAPGPNDNVSLRYLPTDYDRLVTLHFAKGREFDGTMEGSRLHFARITGSPAFKEEPSNPLTQ